MRNNHTHMFILTIFIKASSHEQKKEGINVAEHLAFVSERDFFIHKRMKNEEVYICRKYVASMFLTSRSWLYYYFSFLF